MLYIMSGFDDKTFNINIYDKNKKTIESANNKSESYLILSNEELNNKNREFLIEINNLNNTIDYLEIDSDKMEKSITYQRGLLHNFNSNKKLQSELIKKYKEHIRRYSELNIYILEKYNILLKIINYSLLSSFALMLMSLLIFGDLISFLVYIMIIISSFYIISDTIYDFNPEKISSQIKKYTSDIKTQYNGITICVNDIEKFSKNNDFVSDLFDYC